ncbi:response regulator [Algibacillus agarilyticus]|uniref:response regulator n=1 Tax=Algibacillus agarilyticus TaxID=2234133 RepID=UPI000DCF9396|nr:response regulator [Algibacillus agarilyticus]
MKPGKSLASRHPKVMLLHEHEQDSGVSSLISSHIQDFRAFKITDEAIEAIKEFKPKILLLETDTIADALRHYLTMVKEFELLQHPHQVIILCSNKEVGIAYDVCAQGIFYDYFVTKPMYEKFRLKAILNNLALLFDQADLLLETTNKHIDNMDVDLVDLVEEAQEFNDSLQASIDDCKTALADSEQETSSTSTDANLADILNPIIHQIESNIHQNLSQILQGLTQHQQKNIDTKSLLASALQTQNSVDASIDKAQTMQSDNAANNQGISQDLPPKEEQKKQYKVLLVEDNHIYRDMIKRILENANYLVNEAADGIEALKEIKKDKYDLVIMDLFMPKLDGLNTTKQFRKISNKSDLPIIALTSNKNKDLVKKWVAYGINSYIMKPSKKEQIISAVESALGITETN